MGTQGQSGTQLGVTDSLILSLESSKEAARWPDTRQGIHTVGTCLLGSLCQAALHQVPLQGSGSLRGLSHVSCVMYSPEMVLYVSVHALPHPSGDLGNHRWKQTRKSG